MSQIIIRLSKGLVIDAFITGKGTPKKISIVDENCEENLLAGDYVYILTGKKLKMYETVVYSKSIKALPAQNNVTEILKTHKKVYKKRKP